MVFAWRANCGKFMPMSGAIERRSQPGTRQSAVALAGWLGLTFAAALVGGYFMPGEWYAGLKKPSWNPPNWIFGPVWTTLYAMMAVAAWLAWKRGGWAGQRSALAMFLVQLLLNALWSPFLFGMKSPGLAFVDLMLLWLAVLVTLVTFWRTTPLAGLLLVPYLAWITFAGALNFTLWQLNP